MSQSLAQFSDRLAAQGFQPLNGKRDPFEVLSAVEANVGDAHETMQRAGLFGWQPELIPMSGMDSLGNIYEDGEKRGIVVPQFPGGPAFFGRAGEGFKFQRPETIEDLVYAIAGHGTPLTGVMPGPITRLFFDHQIIDVTGHHGPNAPRSFGAVGDPVKVRWTVDLGNTGKNSLRIGQHVTSLICSNGLTTSRIMGAVSIAHSSLATSKIDRFVEDFGRRAGLGLERWIVDAKRTMATPMTVAQAERLWTELFEWDADKTGRGRTIEDTQRETLAQLWTSPTQQAHGVETAWAFFNATTEYLDHEAVVRFNGGTRAQALARRVVEGNHHAEAVKNRAWDMALAAA